MLKNTLFLILFFKTCFGQQSINPVQLFRKYVTHNQIGNLAELLDQGFEVNRPIAISPWRTTLPLIYALHKMTSNEFHYPTNSHLKSLVIDLLLQAGARIDTPYNDETPLTYAFNHQLQIIKLLLQYSHVHHILPPVPKPTNYLFYKAIEEYRSIGNSHYSQYSYEKACSYGCSHLAQKIVDDNNGIIGPHHDHVEYLHSNQLFNIALYARIKEIPLLINLLKLYQNRPTQYKPFFKIICKKATYYNFFTDTSNFNYLNRNYRALFVTMLHTCPHLKTYLSKLIISPFSSNALINYLLQCHPETIDYTQWAFYDPKTNVKELNKKECLEKRDELRHPVPLTTTLTQQTNENLKLLYELFILHNQIITESSHQLELACQHDYHTILIDQALFSTNYLLLKKLYKKAPRKSLCKHLLGYQLGLIGPTQCIAKKGFLSILPQFPEELLLVIASINTKKYLDGLRYLHQLSKPCFPNQLIDEI